MSQTATEKSLAIRHARVIDALLTKGFNESMEDVAKRAGCDRRTIYRYLDNPAFQKAYTDRVDAYLLSHRGSIAHSLIKAASTLGPGQVSALSLYYKIQGQLTDRLELSATVKVNNDFPVDALPLWLKQALVVVSAGGTISRELEEKVMEEVGMKFIEAEYRLEEGVEGEAENNVVEDEVYDDGVEHMTVAPASSVWVRGSVKYGGYNYGTDEEESNEGSKGKWRFDCSDL